MDMKLELVGVPVSDVDRAKEFYVDKVGFVADQDHRVSDEVRFVPGHGPVSTFGAERRSNPFVSDAALGRVRA